MKLNKGRTTSCIRRHPLLGLYVAASSTVIRTVVLLLASFEEGRNLKEIILYRIPGLVIRVIMHIVNDILKFHV